MPVAVTALWAYSNGFEFFITRLVRPDGPGFEHGRVPSRRRMQGPAVHENMTVGLEFADGSQVIGNVPSPAGNEDPPSRVLDFGGGTGSTHRGDSRWWTWPLPPSGRMDFICQLGAAETRVSMDAQLILDAAQQSVQAWPGALSQPSRGSSRSNGRASPGITVPSGITVARAWRGLVAALT